MLSYTLTLILGIVLGAFCLKLFQLSKSHYNRLCSQQFLWGNAKRRALLPAIQLGLNDMLIATMLLVGLLSYMTWSRFTRSMRSLSDELPSRVEFDRLAD